MGLITKDKEKDCMLKKLFILGLLICCTACGISNEDVYKESSVYMSQEDEQKMEYEETTESEDIPESYFEDKEKIDETEKMEEISVEEARQIQHYEVGEIINYGVYQGVPIEWRVLAADNEKVLLQSVYCVDAQQYDNTGRHDMTWEICTLREWMNTEFLQNAFSASEQKHIIKTALENLDSEITEDRIFILNAEEIVEYLPYEESRVAYPTEYAKMNGITVDRGWINESYTGCSAYWIRGTRYEEPNYLRDFISVTGEIFYDKSPDEIGGVRPAFWYSYEEIPIEENTKESDYIIADSAEKYLTNADLEGVSAEQLRLARNEIYARHGYQFENEELKSYFESKDWYFGRIPREEFVESYLNIYEKYNVQIIQAAENGTEYTGPLSKVYRYEEIEEDIESAFSGDLDLTTYNLDRLCRQWDCYEGETLTITTETINGYPYRFLQFEYHSFNDIYTVALEVYYEDDIQILWLVSEDAYFDYGFTVSYFDRNGNELTENGYPVSSAHYSSYQE